MRKGENDRSPKISKNTTEKAGGYSYSSSILIVVSVLRRSFQIPQSICTVYLNSSSVLQYTAQHIFQSWSAHAVESCDHFKFMLLHNVLIWKLNKLGRMFRVSCSHHHFACAYKLKASSICFYFIYFFAGGCGCLFKNTSKRDSQAAYEFQRFFSLPVSFFLLNFDVDAVWWCCSHAHTRAHHSTFNRKRVREPDSSARTLFTFGCAFVRGSECGWTACAPNRKSVLHAHFRHYVCTVLSHFRFVYICRHFASGLVMKA